MHYDFKQKLNKLDSNAYVGLQIPEIDRILNRALNLYVLLIAYPRLQNSIFGFEKIQRTIDDIRPLVIDDKTVCSIIVNPNEAKLGLGILPDDYMYYLSSTFIAKKNDITKRLDVHVAKHGENIFNSFDSSDFEWGVVNVIFNNKGIQAKLKDFEIVTFNIDYIKTHPYMHNAENFGNGLYKLPSGKSLVGFQDCILPESTHDEITDLAVLLTTNDLNLSDVYQLKKDISITKQNIIN